MKGAEAADPEFTQNANRYLVPITLAMACSYLNLPLTLDRLIRVGANPTRRTIDIADELYQSYSRIVPPVRRTPPRTHTPVGASGRAGRAAAPAHSSAAFRLSPTGSPKSAPGASTPSGVGRTVSGAGIGPNTTALALSSGPDHSTLRERVAGGRPPAGSSRGPSRPRQINTNAWAKKRIAEHSVTLGLPEPVRRRASEMYDRIVAFHTAKTPPPPGSGGQLSPRLNWSLVFTTIYLACRMEEYPKELREILGKNQRPGTIKEMYRLYRYYKRQLQLTINLVDVKTFIHSWIDGFELSDILVDAGSSGEAAWLLKRAIAIGDRARAEAALRKTSTRLIAAGALTTALVERTPPSRLSTFYKAIARFLHMSEETIRFVVAQIAGILERPH